MLGAGWASSSKRGLGRSLCGGLRDYRAVLRGRGRIRVTLTRIACVRVDHAPTREGRRWPLTREAASPALRVAGAHPCCFFLAWGVLLRRNVWQRTLSLAAAEPDCVGYGWPSACLAFGRTRWHTLYTGRWVACAPSSSLPACFSAPGRRLGSKLAYDLAHGGCSSRSRRQFAEGSGGAFRSRISVRRPGLGHFQPVVDRDGSLWVASSSVPIVVNVRVPPFVPSTEPELGGYVSGGQLKRGKVRTLLGTALLGCACVTSGRYCVLSRSASLTVCGV